MVKDEVKTKRHIKNSSHKKVRCEITRFALAVSLSAPAAPLLAPASHAVDGNIRGENGCEDNFIRTPGTFFRTEGPLLTLNHLSKLRSIIMLIPQVPEVGSVVLDLLGANPAGVPIRSVLWIIARPILAGFLLMLLEPL